MSLKETLFLIRHPRAAVEAKLRQAEVSIEVAGPPDGSTIEEFPELPISQAATLINVSRQKETSNQVTHKGGVQLEDWSKADQERMLRGERPKGYPIHRNV
jgi:hypothetical protein